MKHGTIVASSIPGKESIRIFKNTVLIIITLSDEEKPV